MTSRRYLRASVIGGLGLMLVAAADLHARDMRIGLITPPPHQWTVAAQELAEKLEERSGGEMTLSIYPSGQLGNEAQMAQQLQTGALDMVFMTVAEISNRVEDFGALYTPYLVEDIEQAGRFLRESAAAQELLEKLPEEMGVVGLGYGSAQMRTVMVNFNAESAADFDGRRIRTTPLPSDRDFYEMLGAAPTPMPLPDVYDALANRQVDGVQADVEVYWALNMYEHGEVLLDTNHQMFPMVALVSGRVWAQLSEEERALISEATMEALDGIFERYPDIVTQNTQDLRDAGLDVREAGPEFFADVIEEWLAVWTERTPYVDRLRQEAAEMFD